MCCGKVAEPVEMPFVGKIYVHPRGCILVKITHSGSISVPRSVLTLLACHALLAAGPGYWAV